jgi:hypothetical protein
MTYMVTYAGCQSNKLTWQVGLAPGDGPWSDDVADPP